MTRYMSFTFHSRLCPAAQRKGVVISMKRKTSAYNKKPCRILFKKAKSMNVSYLRALTLLCVLVLFLCPCSAVRADGYDFSVQSLDEVMAEFMDSHKLGEDNCAIGWCELTTGETWYFNADKYMVAGSMYKLPLNMAIAERIASGELSPTDPAGVYSVENAVKRSIIYSDNDAAQSLRYLLSYDRDTYRRILASYSGIPEEELPEAYYTENQMSPRFVLNTLQHLYNNAEDYSDLLENLKQAAPGLYFQSTQTDYDIAHKYGSFEGALNDCGIVFTPRPFALVAMFKGGAALEQNLGDLCALMTEYALYLDSPTVEEEEPEPSPTPVIPEATAEPEPEPEPTPEEIPPAAEVQESAGTHGFFTFLISVLAAALLLGLLALLLWKKRGAWAALLAMIVLLLSNTVLLSRPEEAAPAQTAPPPPVETPELISAAAPPSEPVHTQAPAETEPPVPLKTVWTFSFAGDCTIGTVHEWQGYQSNVNMLYVMGGNYSYPFSNVAELFAQDDFTMVNLEGALTDEIWPKSKDYRFRSGPENAEVLARGNVDAVSLANNHSGDYLAKGLEDTRTALENQNVLWTDETAPIITELPGDLKLGVISFNCVEIDLAVGDVDGYMKRIEPLYEQCVEADCDVILAYIHWGWEYRYDPEIWMVELAHEVADLGCDIVIGSHAHVLQEVETYNGVPIFYSLGNFCYGGHANPDDKDTVIIQQDIRREGDEITLGETRYIPCRISSTDSTNDFRPTPYNENDKGYSLVLEKLEVDQDQPT